LKENSESGLVPVQDRNGAIISEKERVKERWAEHSENVLDHHYRYRKRYGKIENASDALNVKVDLFCEEVMMIVVKGLKNSKAKGDDGVVNEFLQYIDNKVRNKLLKIMNMIFEKGKVPSYFRKTLIKFLNKNNNLE